MKYELSKDKIWICDNRGCEVEFTRADFGILIQTILEDSYTHKRALELAAEAIGMVEEASEAFLSPRGPKKEWVEAFVKTFIARAKKEQTSDLP